MISHFIYLISFLSVCFSFNVIQDANSFSGCITYASTVSEDEHTIEKYYFRTNKICVEQEFHYADTIKHLRSVYLFESNPGVVFIEKNGKIKKIPMKKSLATSSIKKDKDDCIVLNHTCEGFLESKEMILSSDNELHVNMHYCVSNTHHFNLPAWREYKPSILFGEDNRIVLKITEIHMSDSVHRNVSYTREAIDIKEYAVPDSIFYID